MPAVCDDIVLAAAAVRRPGTRRTQTPTSKAAADSGRASAAHSPAYRVLGDDGLLVAIVDRRVRARGILAASWAPTISFPDLLAPSGGRSWARFQPDVPAAQADIARGFDRGPRARRRRRRPSRGHRNRGIVLGVEAAEGTDALIARCAPDLQREWARRRAGQSQESRSRNAAPTCLPSDVGDRASTAARAGLRGIAVRSRQYPDCSAVRAEVRAAAADARRACSSWACFVMPDVFRPVSAILRQGAADLSDRLRGFGRSDRRTC